MEPIPKDVIEMADDFFSRLTTEEMIKFLTKYSLEQPATQTLYSEMIKNIKDPEIIVRITLLYLIITRSYQYYDVKLNEISNYVAGDTANRFQEIFRIRNGTTDTTEKLNMEMKTLTHQEDLIDYLFLMIFGSEENPVIYPKEQHWFDSYFAVFTYVLILNNAMTLQIGEEIN